METGLLHLHNLLRWVVLIFGLLTILRGLSGLGGGRAFKGGDKKTALFFMISFDIQLLLGIVLYFMRGWHDVLLSGGVMKITSARFFAVEHMVGMLIAMFLVHAGYSATKKNLPDAAKFKRLFWYSLLAMIVIFAMIPWPFREAVARPLFPGM